MFDNSKFPIPDTKKAKQNESIAWYQVSYLLKITEQLVDNYNESIEEKIIEIVEKIISSDYNNYWVDLNISDIISTLQRNNNISIDIIKKHLDNLKEKNTHSLDNHVIVDKLLPAVLESHDDQKEELLINSVFGYKDSGDVEGVSIPYFDQNIVHLALKKGITVLNTPGTIDADYRGEIGIILINLSNKNFVIESGERICQMIIATHETVEWNLVETLEKTDRGAGGFGHTGKK